VRKQLIAAFVGLIACLVYGSSQAFGYGLPPYSFIYALAVGLIAGLIVYGLLSIRSRWKFWMATVALGFVVASFALIAYAHAQHLRISVFDQPPVR
jgi:hypothetical protein